MTRARAALLLLACAVLLQGEEAPDLQLTECDAVARDGLAFRCRIGVAGGAGDGRTPLRLEVGLAQDGHELAGTVLAGVTLAQLRLGVPVTLFPDMGAVGHPLAEVRLHASIRRDDGQTRTRERVVDTPRQLQARLEACAARLRDHPQADDALPWLWLEEAAERMQGAPSLATCGELAGLQSALTGWQDGAQPAVTGQGDAAGALRDPIDGSVQPWRLHLPAAPDRAAAPVALLLRSTPPGPKHLWPEPPAAWLAAARAAGLAVVEVYPAGDRAWDGIALQRAWPTLAAARRCWPGVDAGRVILVGVGSGAAGAIRLAEGRPERLRALALVDGSMPVARPALEGAGGSRWDALQLAGARPAHLAGLSIMSGGGGDAALQEWGVRAARAGARVNEVADGPDQEAWWRRLAALPPVDQVASQERVVIAPGPVPGAQVEELTAWGTAGSVVVTPGDPPRYATVGIAALRCATPRAVVTGLDGAPAPGAGPRKRLGQATGPIPAYASGPFVIVVGTAESLAARTDNRAVALAFRKAWAQHAQGLARMVDDVAFRARDFPREHLVLIGTPLSNQVLAQVGAAAGLPVSWDARTIAYAGQTWPRADGRSVVLCWPHPAGDGRLLVVIAGQPPLGDGLPLAGLPDLVIGGTAAEPEPAVWKLFGNDWK